MEKNLMIKNAVASVGEKEILSKLSLEIQKGLITAIIGPNRAGKSTLLKLIAGMIVPQAGDVLWGDVNITNSTLVYRANLGIGYVMQGGCIFSSLTVNENLKIAGRELSNTEFQNRIDELTELFPRLVQIGEKTGSSISVCERQMLSITLQLMRRSKLLLLDRPLTGFTPQMTDILFNFLTGINKKFQISIIIVEQNIGTLLQNAHQVFVLKNGKLSFQSLSPLDLLKTKCLENIFAGNNTMSFANAC